MSTSRDDIAESQRVNQQAGGLEEHTMGTLTFQEAIHAIILERPNSDRLILAVLRDLVQRGTEDSNVLSCCLDACSIVMTIRDNIHGPTPNVSHSENLPLGNPIKSSEAHDIGNTDCDFSFRVQGPPSEPSPPHSHSLPLGPSPLAFHMPEKEHPDFSFQLEAASTAYASDSTFPQFEQSTVPPPSAAQWHDDPSRLQYPPFEITPSDAPIPPSSPSTETLQLSSRLPAEESNSNIDSPADHLPLPPRISKDVLPASGMTGNGSSEVVGGTWPFFSMRKGNLKLSRRTEGSQSHDHFSGTYETLGELARSIHPQSAVTTHSSDSALQAHNVQQAYTSKSWNDMTTSDPVNDVPYQSSFTLSEHSQKEQGLPSYPSVAISFSSGVRETEMNDALAQSSPSESFRANEAPVQVSTSSLAPFPPAIASYLATQRPYAKMITHFVRDIFARAVYHGEAETLTPSFEDMFRFWSDAGAVMSNIQIFNYSTAWINFVSQELSRLILHELNLIMAREALPLELTLLPLLEFIVFLQSSPRLAGSARQTIIMFLGVLFQQAQVTTTSESMVRRIRFVLDNISSITRRHEESNSVWPWTQRSQHLYCRTLGSEWLGDLHGTLGTCIEEYLETGALKGVPEGRDVLLGVTELITCLDRPAFEKLCKHHRVRLFKELLENASLTPWSLLSSLHHEKAAVVFIVTVCIERTNGFQSSSCLFLGPQSNTSPYLSEVFGFSDVRDHIRGGNLKQALELLMRMDVQETEIYRSRGIIGRYTGMI